MAVVEVVLSLWKLRVGAEAYYLTQVARGIDDYYNGAGEAEGRWLGTGSQILNLPEAVTGDDLRAVLAGLVPGTGLSPNGTQIRPFTGRVPGFDLTFSAPKSVSVLYAFADPLVRAEVTAAADTAVDEALAWLEREACFVRRGSNNRRAKTAPFEQWGTRRLYGAGFIAAGFRHRTSRAGDPQLHTHVLVANLTRGPEGRWTALDGQALYRSKLAAGVVFQTALRSELTRRLGVRWRPVHDHVADIAGIPQRVLTHFSKRRNEIEDELERMGLSGAAAAAQVTLATRTAKVEIDQATLDERWVEDGASIGFGGTDINDLLAACDPTPAPTALDPTIRVPFRHLDSITGEVHDARLTLDAFAEAIAQVPPERSAAVTRLDVQNTIADHLRGSGSTVFLERLTDYVLAHNELVLLPRPDNATDEAGWEQLWTTRRMMQIEADLRAMFEPTPVPGFALDSARVEQVLIDLGSALGPDQADTVRRLATQGLSVEAVVGRAGTGKTFTMNAVRHVFAAHGRRVVGVCPTARAARELADGAGIETFTVPRLFTEATIGRGDVVIVDEAGMCGTLDLHCVLAHTRDAGAKVVLVGDHHQLPEVAAGGGFRTALEVIGDLRCELTTNRRQVETWEHAALDHLRNGDLAAFWDAYRTRDRITLTDTRGDLHAQALAGWWDHPPLRPRRPSHRRHPGRGSTPQRARPAPGCRRRLPHRTGAHCSGPRVPGGRPSRPPPEHARTDQPDGWDEVPCRQRGTIATITAVHDSGELDIDSPAGPIRLTADYVQSGAVDHGYATTIHKAQGVTCDHIHVVGPAGLYREAAYVALSRARRSAHLYATTREAATIGEPGHTTGIPHAAENIDDPESDLTRAITTSRAKHFVTADHPDLDRISLLARDYDLGALTDRLRFIRSVVADLRRDGFGDPSDALAELRLATDHRRHLHVGERVNARDWDNVGTIEQIDDHAGESLVRFVSETGHATTRRLPWHLLKPIDHVDDAWLTESAIAYLDASARCVDESVRRWQRALSEHGIDEHEPSLIRRAIHQREERATRALRSMPPTWLIWWAGDRPTDPTAAVVYDDHVAELAHWRELHGIDDEIPGFGPPPVDPAHLDEWRTHTDRALATRQFLLDAVPRTSTIDPLDAAAARARIDELDNLIATAPPDQRLIVDQLLASAGDDLTDVVESLRTATDQQQARRDWILEHWPHIVEHHEISGLLAGLDPLAHWPVAPSKEVVHLLDEIARRTATDEPELTPLPELDRLVRRDGRQAEIDVINDERAEVGRMLAAVDGEQPPDAAAAEIVRQHQRRLRERARELDDELRRIRARLRLAKLRPAPNREVEARIDRRVAQIVHEAASQRADWIVEAAELAVRGGELPDLESIIETARTLGTEHERNREMIAFRREQPLTHTIA